MKTQTYKYLSKAELREANRQAIMAGGRAVDPEYIEGLPEEFRYPVFFRLPWERHGWVRCQIGTGCPGKSYALKSVEVQVDEEEVQQ